MDLRKMALAIACVFASLGSFAQTTTTSEKPAVAAPDSTNPTASVKGKKSFTEAQAKERMEEAG